MTLYVEIKADTNDADYVTSRECIDLEDLEVIRKICTAIKNCKKLHNWPQSDYSDDSPYEIYKGILSEEEIEIFSDMCPSGEYGIHSIYEVKLLQVTAEEDLL